ncbi:MAG: hypothetical protein HY553_12595, partial [Elusimicrobia bacterium]|nr:hypothetical protein [Elusimicrobiota bacterium]
LRATSLGLAQGMTYRTVDESGQTIDKELDPVNQFAEASLRAVSALWDLQSARELSLAIRNQVPAGR